jgi:hypothetical protein
MSEAWTDMTSVVWTESDAWSLAAASPTTAWLCGDATVTPVSSPQYSGSDCLRIDATGNVLSRKLTLQINGQTVLFH